MTHAQAEDGRVEWEGALVQRACAGDTRAFERLYREHAGRVYGLCLRMTRDPQLAEDCTQDTFINAWRALPRFETRSSLSTWLHRIAVNVSLAKRRKSPQVEPMPEDDEGGGGADFTLETPVEVREIETAIGELPDGARDALVLHALYGYSHGEAAQMLGVAEGTCKAQLHRARKLLRDRLGVEVN
ncbi:MAG TPA: sigma-70 family RNA polymerase sigma factor [Steroidobacteraceae bacterium]|jgi:RNA polymerase sigma-70 factor, ECF subfamily|nr:sigma-70 family RNA polymerase sigma factor [Steroidobacteraceae bacterium]